MIFFPLTAGSKLSLEMIAEATILLVLGWFSWFAAGKFYHVKYDPPKSRT